MDQKKVMSKKIKAAVKALGNIEDLVKKNPALADILKEAKIKRKSKSGFRGMYTIQYTIHDQSYEVIV